MKTVQDIEATWGLSLPGRFPDLYQVQDRSAIRLPNGEVFRLPFPVMNYDEIVQAKNVAADWEIPGRVVPIIGDFHDLVCLDYLSGKQPCVIAMDDERTTRFLFDRFDAFLDAPRVEIEESPIKPPPVVKEKTWFDF